MKLMLRHYGSTHFNPEEFKPMGSCPSNYRNKPTGGLWTSPIDSKWGWRQWCECEEWGTENLTTYFDLMIEGRILVINCEEDLEKLPWKPNVMGQPIIDFNKLKDYDAIHLTRKGEYSSRFSTPKNLYGWDCETVFIINKEAILCLNPGQCLNLGQ